MQTAATDNLGIYRALYNHVTSRLQTALPGSVLPLTLPAFLYTVSISPTHTDLAAVDEFSDILTFLQTAYWGLLGRLPDENEIQRWTTTATDAQPRRDILCYLLGSAEFSGRHITVSNIPAYSPTEWADCFRELFHDPSKRMHLRDQLSAFHAPTWDEATARMAEYLLQIHQ